MTATDTGATARQLDPRDAFAQLARITLDDESLHSVL